MDPHPLPRLRFPWGKLILFCTLLGLILIHYFPAPINRLPTSFSYRHDHYRNSRKNP